MGDNNFKGKDINAWAKDLKHNEKTANKYKGVKTVEDILRVAREDGYNFTEKELLDFNLDMVAGGALGTSVNTKIGVDVGDKNQQQQQQQQQQQNQETLSQGANSQGSNNTFNFNGKNSSDQSIVPPNHKI